MTQKDIIEKYYKRIHDICLYNTGYNKAEADNCTNEVFITLIIKWEGIKKRNDLFPWLLKTTENKLKEYYRRKKKDSKIVSIEEMQIEDTSNTELVDLVVSDKEIEMNKENILNELSEEERKLYNDYFEKKLSYNEIAGSLGIKYSAAQMRVSKLRKKLEKKVLEIYCIGYTSSLVLKLLISLMGER